MILDKQNLFSEDQVVASTAASTNVIDLGALGAKVNDPNIRTNALVHAQVTNDFDTCTSVTVALQTDSDEAFGTAVTLKSETVLLAALLAGKKFNGIGGRLPEGCSRYIRLYYTVAGSDNVAGTILAGLTLDDPTGM